MHLLAFSSSASALCRRRQWGAVAVEFGLIALLFFTLLLGTMEFGRWLFTLNAAGEATRWGAHLAAVCDKNAPVIKTRMQSILSNLTDEQIDVYYFKYDAVNARISCGTSDCKGVQVSLLNAKFVPLFPFAGVDVTLPRFITSLPIELMSSTVGGAANPVCS